VDDEVQSDLAELGFEKDKGTMLLALWSKSKSELIQAAIDSTLSVNQLQDIDWRFGVVASSKSMDKVGNTFLQMKIHREDKKVVNLELSLEQFYAFLGEMEKAEATLKSF
jgi:hypothetical protein